MKQPNRWSCVPTAFAMVTGIPVDEIIKAVGHDGSEILYPELPEPQRRRGFHILEITKVMFDRGIYFCPFFKELRFSNRPGFELFDLEPYLQTRQGVITGRFNNQSHAVAYNPPWVFDPNGTVYRLDQTKVQIQQFWVVV